ncbi:MAG: O-antigen ligase family protein [Anaerolineales bacterium]|nr:MAG: O-antigen ligase family protein [Anaerolineales bacterium]
MKVKFRSVVTKPQLLIFDFLWLLTVLVYWKLLRGVGLELYWLFQVILLSIFLVGFFFRLSLNSSCIFPSIWSGSSLDLHYLGTVVFGSIWLIAFVRRIIGDLLQFDLFNALVALCNLIFWLVYATYLFMVIQNQRGSRNSMGYVLLFVFWGFGFYVGLNLLAFSVGVMPDSSIYLTSYPSQLLSMLGSQGNRILFPLADGINSFGVSAGAVLVLFIPILFSTKDTLIKLTSMFFSLSSIAVMVMTDSRGAILFAWIAGFLYLLPGRISKHLIWLSVFVSFLPLLVALFFPALLNFEYGFTRPPGNLTEKQRMVLEEEFCADKVKPLAGPLSNRPIIWAVALDEFKHPRFVHLVGYGYRGQVDAGISEDLSCIFLSFVYRRFASSHNIWLQIITEIGYIGVIGTLFLFYKTAGRLYTLIEKDNSGFYKGMRLALIYIVFAGTLESILSPDYYIPFAMFLAINIMTLLSANDIES